MASPITQPVHFPHFLTLFVHLLETGRPVNNLRQKPTVYNVIDIGRNY